MKQFIRRTAEDQWDVPLVAEAIESCGGEVVAINSIDQATHEGALKPHWRYEIWARVEPDTFDEIDEAIEKALEEGRQQ